MNTLNVSIIIPTYNREKFIEKALLSALRECIPGDEVIVVDDGSSDNTVEVLRPYMDRIHYVRIPNSGAGVARNKGIELAKNPLVAFLDSDDQWIAGKLYWHRTLMNARPDILFSFSNLASRKDDGFLDHNCLIWWHGDSRSWGEILGSGCFFSKVGKVPEGSGDFKFYVGDIYAGMLTAPYICTCTVVVRRKEAGDSLRFPDDLPLYEDWECFGQLSGRGKGAYLECETLVQGDHIGDRLSRTDYLTSLSTRITIIERVWGNDTHFFEQHGDLYRKTLAGQRLKKAAELISLGRNKEARKELRLVEDVPLSHRILASLPGQLARSVLALRRHILRLFRPGRSTWKLARPR